MELYISACSKAADVAATKTATSGLTTESQQCGDVSGPQAGQLCPPLRASSLGGRGGEGGERSRALGEARNRPAFRAHKQGRRRRQGWAGAGATGCGAA